MYGDDFFTSGTSGRNGRAGDDIFTSGSSDSA